MGVELAEIKQQAIQFPPKQQEGPSIEVKHSGVVVGIGANGSGKSRLGEWLDFSYPDEDVRERVYRISAQKSLRFPKTLTTTSVEVAKEEVLYGRAFYPHERGRPKTFLVEARERRWQFDEPIPLDDYSKVVRLLYTEHVGITTAMYEQAGRALASGETVNIKEVPDTKLNRLMRLWEVILPHRKVRVRNGEVEVYANESNVYNASGLSDGERVIFYLIGQCLAAPEDAVLVIDEPELHLHKAVESRLWDAIEAARPDCTFVYLTHDVQFAATRRYATKVWLKRYDGHSWDYEVVNEDVDLPQDLYLSLLGSRASILFTEATSGSYDERLYRSIFSDMTVVPLGSCADVIRSVKAFRRLASIHNLECYGIVDRDRRSDAEVQKLEAGGTNVLKVSEIENLFLAEEVLQAIEKLEAIPKEESYIDAIKQKVFTLLEKEKGNLAVRISQARLRRAMSGGLKETDSLAELEKNLEDIKQSLDAAQLHQTALAEIEVVLKKRDYDAALKIFDNKGLISSAAQKFGRRNENLKEWVYRQVQTPEGKSLKEAIRRQIPRFNDSASAINISLPV